MRTSILPGSKIQSWPAGAWLHTDGVVPNPPRSPVIGWLVSNTFSAGHSSGFPRALHRSVVGPRSEEHTSELQSRENLVCRLLLEKKKPYTTSASCTAAGTRPLA